MNKIAKNVFGKLLASSPQGGEEYLRKKDVLSFIIHKRSIEEAFFFTILQIGICFFFDKLNA